MSVCVMLGKVTLEAKVGRPKNSDGKRREEETLRRLGREEETLRREHGWRRETGKLIISRV